MAQNRNGRLIGAYVPEDVLAFVQTEAKDKFAGNVSALINALLRAYQRGDIQVNVLIRQRVMATDSGAHEIYDASAQDSAGA
jgi:hypothetical protein